MTDSDFTQVSCYSQWFPSNQGHSSSLCVTPGLGHPIHDPHCSLSGLVSAHVYSPFSLSSDLIIFPLPFWLHIDVSYSHGCTGVFLPDSMKTFTHVDAFLLCSWGRVSSTFSYSTILFNPSKIYFLNSWSPKFLPLKQFCAIENAWYISLKINSEWGLLQILKDNAVKVLHSTCQQIWKTEQWSQDWER